MCQIELDVQALLHRTLHEQVRINSRVKYKIQQYINVTENILNFSFYIEIHDISLMMLPDNHSFLEILIILSRHSFIFT